MKGDGGDSLGYSVQDIQGMCMPILRENETRS